MKMHISNAEMNAAWTSSGRQICVWTKLGDLRAVCHRLFTSPSSSEPQFCHPYNEDNIPEVISFL